MEYEEIEKLILNIAKEKGCEGAIDKLEEFIPATLDKRVLAQLLVLKTRLFILYCGDISKGMENLNKALSAIEDIDDRLLKARLYNSVAGIFLYSGDTHNALGYYQKALKLLKEGEYDYFRVMNNMGEAYKRVGKHEKALEYFRKAYKLAEEMDVKKVMVYIAENIGEIYVVMGKLERAEPWLNRAYEIAKEIDESRMLRYIEMIEAMKKGDEEEMEKLEEEMRKHGEIHELGDVFFYFHQFAPSELQEKLLKKAIIIFSEIRDGNMQKAAIEKLQELEKTR